MVWTTSTDVDTKLSLPDYVEFVREHIRTDDFDSMCENAWALRALANDRQFILDLCHDELKQSLGTDVSPISRLATHSLLIHFEENFFIRLNMWPAANPRRDPVENAIYAYGTPHNHNYHFSTVGYFGPGYSTSLCRLESAPLGFLGEQVEFADFKEQTLGPGVTTVYEAIHDVHTQFAPTSVSASLNIVAVNRTMDPRPQLIFDIEQGRVIGSLGSSLSKRLGAFDLLRFVHDENSLDIITSLAQSDCPRRSAVALNVLKEIDEPEFARYFARAHPEVRKLHSGKLAIGDDFFIYGGQFGRQVSLNEDAAAH